MNEKKSGSMIGDALILFAITLIAGLVLGTVYQVTKEPIAVQKEKAKQEACMEVFQDAVSFEETEVLAADGVSQAMPGGWAEQGFDSVDIGAVMAAKDAGGATLGYVITVNDHEGYGGDIEFMMGVRNDGSLNGISLLSIAETAGLGMRAEEVLKPQFVNKNAESFEYVKSGAMGDNQIEAISGATITTHAVTNGVNAGLYYFREMLMEGGNGNG
ncbi:MAG: FMN-binding protein [Lachnospiraceae bacterium]|jgi:electron transport complex protein RnfG|nr:FMN-binding protein [Lachnospiraceae bacterium]